MDTPRSSSSQSLSDPSELLDHRNQPQSLPRPTLNEDHKITMRDFAILTGAAVDLHRSDGRACRRAQKIVPSIHSVNLNANETEPSNEFRDHRMPFSLGLDSRPRRNTDDSRHSDSSLPEDVVEDVCFPLSEETRRHPGQINFDEMDEFVGDQDTNKNRSRKYSVASTFRGCLFETHRSYVEDAIDDSDSNSEKLSEKLQRNWPYTQHMAEKRMEKFSFFSSEITGTIHADNFGDLLIEGQSFQDLFLEGKTWWLDCLNPSDAEMRMLAKSFGIHPLTVEDIRVQEAREKVELFKSYYFVCFRSFQQLGDQFDPINIYIVVFRDGVLSFHFSPAHHSNNVRRRIRQLRDYVTLTADWICYALIDDITDSFGPVIQQIEKQTDAIEDAVFVSRESDIGELLRQIGTVRKTVMSLMRLLGGKADVIKMFSKRCNEQWDVAPKGEIGLYLGDIQDHIITMYQNLGHYEKILSRSHSNYLAQLSVDSIATNNRVNQMLGKITLIGTILIPLNFVTGLWGMNVPVPGQHSSGFTWWFGILGIVCCVAVCAFFIARRLLWRMGT